MTPNRDSNRDRDRHRESACRVTDTSKNIEAGLIERECVRKESQLGPTEEDPTENMKNGKPFISPYPKLIS